MYLRRVNELLETLSDDELIAHYKIVLYALAGRGWQQAARELDEIERRKTDPAPPPQDFVGPEGEGAESVVDLDDGEVPTLVSGVGEVQSHGAVLELDHELLKGGK